MNSDQIDSKFADHDRWFAEMRELTLANTTAIQETMALTDANARAIQETKALTDSNARVIQALCELAAEDRQERQAIIARTDEMLFEIRGLQAENRRILDILLNNQNNQNNQNN